MPRAGSLIAVLSIGEASRPSRVMVLSEVTRVCLIMVFGAGRLQCMARVLRNTPLPIGPREIDQPPPLRDFAPRQPRREFRSGNGLLLPIELGFFLPHRQHEHGEFSCGGHGRLREASSSCKANSPALQGRKFPHSCDQGCCGLEQQAPHDSVAAFRHPARPVHCAGLVPFWCQPEKGAYIRGLAEPRWFIDQRDEIQRHHRPDAGNGHQTARYGMVAGHLLHGSIEIGGSVACVAMKASAITPNSGSVSPAAAS